MNHIIPHIGLILLIRLKWPFPIFFYFGLGNNNHHKENIYLKWMNRWKTHLNSTQRIGSTVMYIVHPYKVRFFRTPNIRTQSCEWENDSAFLVEWRWEWNDWNSLVNLGDHRTKGLHGIIKHHTDTDTHIYTYLRQEPCCCSFIEWMTTLIFHFAKLFIHLFSSFAVNYSYLNASVPTSEYIHIECDVTHIRIGRNGVMHSRTANHIVYHSDYDRNGCL